MEKFAVFRPSEGSSSEVPPLAVQAKGCLLDTLAFPMHNRTCRSVMGLLVGNSKASNRPASQQCFGFNLNFNDVPPGNANALHSHKTLEWFFAYTGDFEIRAGRNGRSKVHLAKGDFIIVPPDVDRYFKCVAGKDQLHHCAELESEGGCAMILTGTVGEPWVQWSTDVVAAAREKGVRCTDAGILFDAGAEPREQEWREVHDVSQEQLETFVHRAADRPRVAVPLQQGGGRDMRFEYVEVGAASAWSPEAGRGCVVCHLSGPPLRLEGGSPAAAAAKEVVKEAACRSHLQPMEVLVVGRDEPEWRLELADEPASTDSGAVAGDAAAAVLFVISSSLAEASQAPSPEPRESARFAAPRPRNSS